MLVYLAGPITGLTYDGCTEWRSQVKHDLPYYIQTISPMRGKQRLEEIANGGPILDSYKDNPLSSDKGINARDYWDVRRCDAVFVNLLGATKVSIGTVMEIAWARAFNKPVVCVMEKDNIHSHSMLNYACGFQVEDLQSGLDILSSILGTDSQIDGLTLEIVNKPPLPNVNFEQKPFHITYPSGTTTVTYPGGQPNTLTTI